MRHSLRISGSHYESIRRHLFPQDGLEAIVFAFCGCRSNKSGDILTVSRVMPVPYELCKRTRTGITWPTDILVNLLGEARKQGLAIVKIHSHPSGYCDFSDNDNTSDEETFSAVINWLDNDRVHGSAVMLPDGRIFGRLIKENKWAPISIVSVAGNSIHYWGLKSRLEGENVAFEAQKQLFGSGTTSTLRKLRVGIVGCSGTGSIVLELLTRLGVGSFVLVDHDRIEERNLNRIINSKRSDIGQSKVKVLASAIRSFGLGTKVLPLTMNLFDPIAVKAISGCDVVFGCMDTAEGRQILNRIATFYLIPYLDVGVHLAADGNGGISEASGVIHYIQPGRSSLLSRKAYTRERIRAENLHRTDPTTYKDQFDVGYIEGVEEKSPAVASINATIASIAVNEFLDRIHHFRSCNSNDCAIVRYNFMETLIVREDEGADCPILTPHVGRGDVIPLLDMPSLSK